MALGQLLDLLLQGRVAGIQRVVGADRAGAHQDLVVDVERDDRVRADQPGQLHDVRADPADPPHADGLADAHLAGVHHGPERCGDGVSEQGRLLERHLLGHAGQAERLRDGVLRPRAVVGEGHELDVHAVAEPAAQAVLADAARPARGGDDAVADGPADDVGPERGDRARRLVPLGDHVRHERAAEHAVDQAEVGVADAAVSDLDQHLARARLGDGHVLDRPFAGRLVEALRAHGPGHPHRPLVVVTGILAPASPPRAGP